jgi:hypothetical protein
MDSFFRLLYQFLAFFLFVAGGVFVVLANLVPGNDPYPESAAACYILLIITAYLADLDEDVPALAKKKEKTDA